MKTRKNLIVTLIITAFLLSVPALALADRNPCGMNPCEKKEHKEKRHKMMKEHHKMKMEKMEMFKEVMTILRDLNHKPSDKEKKKLTEMIDRIGEMEKTMEKDMKKWKKHHKKDKMMNGMGGMDNDSY